MLDYEKYTLILRHDMVSNDGRKISLDEPLVLDYCVERFNKPSMPILINTMMDTFRNKLIKRLENDNGTYYSCSF